MVGGRDVEERAPQPHLFRGASVQFEPILAAKIEVGLPANIAPLRRARPKLFKMQKLPDQPACPLAQASLHFLLGRRPWSNDPYRAVREHRDGHGRPIGILRGVVERMG